MKKNVTIILLIAMTSVMIHADDGLVIEKPSVYSQLKIKNRARHYAGEVSANGDLYIFADSQGLRDLETGSSINGSLMSESPNAKIRNVHYLIKTFTPTYLELQSSKSGSDHLMELGTITIDADDVRRKISLNTIILIKQLEIRSAK
ncbi:hypothetical protein JXA80_12160 [bacterium]|nr:hypothetical protein [candidate division CSSED10-310 bacterium]